MEQLKPPSTLDERKKVKQFLYLVGAKGRDLFKALKIESTPSTEESPEAHEFTLKAVLEAFEKHCYLPKNETVDRYKFFTRQQVGGETLEQYVTELKTLGANCNFNDLHDSMIRDRIIGGIQDDGLRVRLLCESELTLDKCLQICRAVELSKERMAVFDKAQSQDVHAVRKLKPKMSGKTVRQCRYCGKSHAADKNKCPAYGQKCNKCQKENHFASVCKTSLSKPGMKGRSGKKPVYAVDAEEDMQDFFVDGIKSSESSKDWFVERCEICRTYRASNRKEPMHDHDIHERPWQKVESNLFEFAGSTYLILVDLYSNYFEFDKLACTSSTAVIALCKQQFARHGIPEEMISDNGPQFASAEFQQFCAKYGLRHLTFSPRYAKSHGKVEKAVQITKHFLKKSAEEGEDVHLALLAYRNTPGDGLPSPVQMMVGRRTNTTLPTSSRLLGPVRQEPMLKRKKELQELSKTHPGKGAPSPTRSSSTIPEEVILRLSEEIPNDKVLMLGLKLGHGQATVARFEATNYRGTEVTSIGTRAMLFSWSNAMGGSEAIPTLRKALKESGLVRLSEIYL